MNRRARRSATAAKRAKRCHAKRCHAKRCQGLAWLGTCWRLGLAWLAWLTGTCVAEGVLGGSRSAPEPLLENERRLPTCPTSRGRGKPCQLTPGTIRSPSRTTANAAKSALLCFPTDLLTRGMRHELASSVQRIRTGEIHGGDAFSRMDVGNPLVSGQSCADEQGAVVVPEVLGFVRPRTDKQAEVETRRRPILVEIERRKTVGWVPSAPVPRGVAGI